MIREISYQNYSKRKENRDQYLKTKRSNISKEKKEIKWKGLPNNANHDLEMLQKEKERCLNSIKQKRQGLQEVNVTLLA